MGQFLAQGPYFPLLELQARWIVAVWTGEVSLPGYAEMREVIAQPRPPLDAHNALALTLSEQLAVAPERLDWPELAEALVFGPLLPPRYRLSGPGAQPHAATRFRRPACRLAALRARPRRPRRPAHARLARRGRRDRRGGRSARQGGVAFTRWEP
jgi:hypothetical protein